MGITECEIHGLSAILPVCREIENDVISAREPRKIIAIWTLIDPGAEEGAAMGFLACEICVNKMSAPDSSSIITSDEFGLIDVSGLTGICGTCFDGYLKTQKVDWTDFMPVTTAEGGESIKLGA